MLHIFFDMGNYGSTIQYIIRKFNKNYFDASLKGDPIDQILSDGSMHKSGILGHFHTKNDLIKYCLNNEDKKLTITAPFINGTDYKLAEVISLFKEKDPQDKIIIIYNNSNRYSDIRLLSMYNKYIVGSGNQGFKNSPMDFIDTKNIKQWNSNYSDISDLKNWELRELISLFISDYKETDNFLNLVDPSWLVLSTEEILNNTSETFKKIVKYSGNLDPLIISELEKFAKIWREKQQYIIDQIDLCYLIVDSVLYESEVSWSTNNIIMEAMIQNYLRQHGYNIKCANLDVFPKCTKDLKSLLESI